MSMVNGEVAPARRFSAPARKRKGDSASTYRPNSCSAPIDHRRLRTLQSPGPFFEQPYGTGSRRMSCEPLRMSGYL